VHKKNKRILIIPFFLVDFLTASIAMLATLTFGLAATLYTVYCTDLMLKSVFFCKFRNYYQQVAYMIMRWSLVAACLDRVALSSYNIRWHRFARVYVAYRVVAIMTVVWLILPAPSLFYYDIRGPSCGSAYNLATQYYHASYVLFTGFVLPVSIMIISALVIFSNLVNKRKRRQVMVVKQQEIRNLREDAQRRRDRQVLFILLGQSVAYFIASAPWFTYLFYLSATISVNNKSAERIAIERFAYFLAEPIQYLFPILSFYLYVMTSSVYRSELLIMIRSLLRCGWWNNIHRVEPATSNPANQNRNEHQT
jgi:hypothetical protein